MQDIPKRKFPIIFWIEVTAMLTYEEWLEETGREANEDSYWEYLWYVENAEES